MGWWSNSVSRKDLRVGDHVYSWRRFYLYAHHGIYMTENRVLHFRRPWTKNELASISDLVDFLFRKIENLRISAPAEPNREVCPDCKVPRDRGGMVFSCVDCFLVGFPLYRYKYREPLLPFLLWARGGTGTLAKADSTETVLQRANYLRHTGFGLHDILRNNCEDFATYCTTGLLVGNKSYFWRTGQAGAFRLVIAVVITLLLRLVAVNSWVANTGVVAIICFCRYSTDIGIRRDVTKVAVEDLARVLKGWDKIEYREEASKDHSCCAKNNAGSYQNPAVLTDPAFCCKDFLSSVSITDK